MPESSLRQWRDGLNAFKPNGLHQLSWLIQEHLQGRKSAERPKILRTTEVLFCLFGSGSSGLGIAFSIPVSRRSEDAGADGNGMEVWSCHEAGLPPPSEHLPF